MRSILQPEFFTSHRSWIYDKHLLPGNFEDLKPLMINDGNVQQPGLFAFTAVPCWLFSLDPIAERYFAKYCRTLAEI